MFRWITALLVVSWLTFVMCAQTPREQPPTEPTSTAQQEVGVQNSVPATPVADSSSAATETTQYPLEQFQNFSAVGYGGPLPSMEVDRHIYRSGKIMRMEGNAAVPNYYVTDLAKQESHMVEANGCLKLSTVYTRSFPFDLFGKDITYERIPIGQQTVDGHRCRVEDIKIHNPNNPVVMHFRLYEAEDLEGFPIQIENRREHAKAWVMHFKNVRVGPQDPTLFVFPNKCQTMAGFKPLGSTPKGLGKPQ